jgi:hypothetical protein
MKRAIALTALLLLAAARARGALQVDEQQVDGGTLTVFKMTVTPAAEPVPALQHRLLLREIDEKSGNAATMYYRAILMSEIVTKRIKDQFKNDADAALNAWSSDWPVDKWRSVAEVVDSSSLLGALREAALRRNCDWGFNLDTVQGIDLFAFLLPEIQESRQMSRFLMLKARLAVVDGKFDDAIDLLRINLKMALDIAREPLLVNGLVGIAEVGMGNRVLIDLIAAPDSPNMYWALTELGDPVIDLRPATRFEMSSVYRVFPFLRHPESAEHSPEEWARLLAQGISDLGPLTNGSVMPDETVRRAGVTALGLATYGPAKQRLLQTGYDQAHVDAMPVGQVMSIDAARAYRTLSDGLEKWWYIPYPEARERDGVVEAQLTNNKLQGGYGALLARILLPAINAARQAQERLQWQIGGLRTVEAIRMYAAKHGKLPARLEDIDAVPLPINRVTGRPYQYQLKGDAAVVELPFSDGFAATAWRLEIQLNK